MGVESCTVIEVVYLVAKEIVALSPVSSASTSKTMVTISVYYLVTIGTVMFGVVNRYS